MAKGNLKLSIFSFIIRLSCLFTKRFTTNASDIDCSEVKNITIFSTTALGDFMFNTPAISSIRRRFPDAKITLISSLKNKALVEKSPWFNRIIYWDQKIKDFIPVVSSIRKNKPDITFLLHSKSPYDVLFARLGGSASIFKDAYNDVDRKMACFTTAVSKKDFMGHLIERKLHLLESLGCCSRDISMKIPYNVIKPKKDDCFVTVGFQLGASEEIRQWPIKRFQELASLLASSGDYYKIILIGSSKERALAHEFLSGLSESEKLCVTDTLGKLSLTELVDTISQFDYLVTGDTGPLHLAVALRVKTISLFVTANPDHTGPLQDPELHTIIRASSDECSTNDNQPMGVISAENVMLSISRKSVSAA